LNENPKRKHAQTCAHNTNTYKNNLAFICFCQFDLQLLRYFKLVTASLQFSLLLIANSKGRDSNDSVP